MTSKIGRVRLKLSVLHRMQTFLRKDSSCSKSQTADYSSVDAKHERRDDGSISRWALAFENLLADPYGVKVFGEFLAKEYSGENLTFWLACQDYKSMQDTSQRYIKANQIYTKHLSSNAADPINVDYKTMKILTECLMDQSATIPPVTLFDDAQKQVFILMRADSYNRFINSPLYQSVLVKELESKARKRRPTRSTIRKRTTDQDLFRDSYSKPETQRTVSSSGVEIHEKKQRSKGSRIWRRIRYQSLDEPSTLMDQESPSAKSEDAVFEENATSADFQITNLITKLHCTRLDDQRGIEIHCGEIPEFLRLDKMEAQSCLTQCSAISTQDIQGTSESKQQSHKAMGRTCSGSTQSTSSSSKDFSTYFDCDYDVNTMCQSHSKNKVLGEITTNTTGVKQKRADYTERSMSKSATSKEL